MCPLSSILDLEDKEGSTLGMDEVGAERRRSLKTSCYRATLPILDTNLQTVTWEERPDYLV